MTHQTTKPAPRGPRYIQTTCGVPLRPQRTVILKRSIDDGCKSFWAARGIPPQNPFGNQPFGSKTPH